MVPFASFIADTAVHTAPALLAPPVGWSLATALVAVALAALLRRLRLPGGAIAAGALAGLLAGLLLGPGVLGRVLPEFGTAALAGDPAILAPLRAVEREEAALGLARGAPTTIGADASDIEADLAARRTEAEAAWAAERERHAAARGLLALLLAATLLAASASASSVRAPMRRAQTGEALLLAAWSTLPVLALLALSLHLFGVEPLAPASLALAGAVIAGSFGLARDDRRVAQSVTPGGGALVEQAARWASAAAIGLVLVACVLAPDGRFAFGAALALACLPLGWLAGRTALPLASLGCRVALPALTAIAFLGVEPFRDIGGQGLWIALILYLLIEDGRWVGASIGHWIAGRGTAGSAGILSSMRLAIAGMASEPIAIALLGVGAATGILPAWLVGPALLAATGSALLAKLRASAADRLASAEAEIAALRNPDA